MTLPGVSGTLFPAQYLADRLRDDALGVGADPISDSARRALERWWQTAERSCGPASGLRAVFDVAAMPMFGIMGFRARRVTFDKQIATSTLETPGGLRVSLVVLPWAARASGRWRDVVAHARAIGATWGLVFAPPFLGLLDARPHATRRSQDFRFPDVLDAGSARVLWHLTSVTAFDPVSVPGRLGSRLDELIARSERYQQRVRADLEAGVREALHALGPLHTTSESLTIVYRILFLLFAEARHLVPDDHPIYRRAYAMATLCRDAVRNEREPGLWEALGAVSRLARRGCRTANLNVYPFNGRLFSKAAAPTLERRLRDRRRAVRADFAMRSALVALGSRQGPRGREEISYADLGVEQLGSVYEHVLDVEPRAGTPARGGKNVHSHARKASGTFYTPRALTEFVVRRTLAPLVDGASSDAILALRVVDPAMGSGAFLVAACRYLADAYEQALVEEGRLSPSDTSEETRADARRLVAERCLAGVDRNPTAVHLAHLSLWLTTLARQKPLGFLDHRLRVGDSLIGTRPEDMHGPTGLRRRGSSSRPTLFDVDGLAEAVRLATRPLGALTERRDDTVEDVRAKGQLWHALQSDRSPVSRWRLALSLWCARWFWPKDAGLPPTEREVRAAVDTVTRGDTTLPASLVARWLETTRAVSARLGFFHWPLEFADVFYDDTGTSRGQRAGFDAVIGNPPWEMLRKDGPETTSGRQELHRFIRESGQFPSCQLGHVNLYQPFVDRAMSLVRTGGRVGLILPWGLATDDGAATLRRELVERGGVETLVGFDNARALFPIHRGTRFMALFAHARVPRPAVNARFGVQTPAEIEGLPGRVDPFERHPYPIELRLEQLQTISGVACRIPDVRRFGDLELADDLRRAHPPLASTDGWNVTFGRELNATEHKHCFTSSGLPILEGKHVFPFRADEKMTTSFIDAGDAERLLPDRRFERARLAYRDVAAVSNRVSLIAAVLRPNVVTTHTLFCSRGTYDEERLHFLSAFFNSYVLNVFVRLLMGTHLTTTLVEELPVPIWRGTRAHRTIARLSRRIASGRHTTTAGAFVQACVADAYGLDARRFSQLLRGFPLVPEDARTRAVSALERLRGRPRALAGFRASS